MMMMMMMMMHVLRPVFGRCVRLLVRTNNRQERFNWSPSTTYERRPRHNRRKPRQTSKF